jgi:diaminopimelate decarboxylase
MRKTRDSAAKRKSAARRVTADNDAKVHASFNACSLADQFGIAPLPQRLS